MKIVNIQEKKLALLVFSVLFLIVPGKLFFDSIESGYLIVPVSILLFILFIFSKYKLKILKEDVLFISFFIYLLISSFIVGLLNIDSYFNFNNLITSSFNIFLYVFISILSFHFFKKNRLEYIFFYLLVILLSYAWFNYLLLWFGVFKPVEEDLFRRFLMPYIMRGIFNEPSHFSVFIVLLYTLVKIKNNYISKKRLKVIGFITFISTVLSLSFSGIILFLVLLIISSSIYKNILFLFLFILLFILIQNFSLDSMTELNDIFNRFSRIIDGTDASANYRLFDTWIIVSSFTTIVQLLFGIGIGQFGSYSVDILGFSISEPFVASNIFSIVFSFGGLSYLLFLIFLLYYMYKKVGRMSLVFSVSLFTHGYFGGVFFVLFIYYFLKDKNEFILYKSNVIQ
ncbi:MAG TPA: hypothetical protein EYG73_11980 [Arcobacter sp.]|nr:hypothetical protein [Arcobacter sp.]